MVEETNDDHRHEVYTMNFPKHSNPTPLPMFEGTDKRLEDGLRFFRHPGICMVRKMYENVHPNVYQCVFNDRVYPFWLIST